MYTHRFLYIANLSLNYPLLNIHSSHATELAEVLWKYMFKINMHVCKKGA